MDDGLPDDQINALAAGPDGRLWIGTQDGVAVYDDQGLRPYNGGSLGSLEVNDIAVGADGTPFFASDSSGLVYPTDVEPNQFAFDRRGHGLASDEIAAVEFASDGTLWVLSSRDRGRPAGLARRVADRTYEAVPLEGFDDNTDAHALAALADGRMLVGTDAGLHVVHPSGAVDQYTVADGLLARSPRQILVVPGSDEAWVMTNSGIVRFTGAPEP
jgi:ligand-binding sensor domain-containing protein